MRLQEYKPNESNIGYSGNHEQNEELREEERTSDVYNLEKPYQASEDCARGTSRNL